MKTVRDILVIKGNKVWTISPNATVFDAINEMVSRSVSTLVVIEHDQTIGIFSEHDCVRRIMARKRDPNIVTVREVMTRKPITIKAEDNLKDCIELINTKRIRHLPVVEGKALVGIISIGDLLKVLVTQKKHII